MFRFFYVIFINLFRMPYMIPKMRYYADHQDRFSEGRRYQLARRVISIINHTGCIRTHADGMENLPEEGGYLLYPNHQGKYDVLGIMITHDKPCSFIMDEKKSRGILIREFTDMLNGGRIDQSDLRGTLLLFKEIAARVAAGARYIIFSEGGYYPGKKNNVGEFKPGSFKLAKMARVPIVPVAIYDTYKAFNSPVFGPVYNRVRYLEPIPYETYRNMRTREIAELVRLRIQEALRDLEAAAAD